MYTVYINIHEYHIKNKHISCNLSFPFRKIEILTIFFCRSLSFSELSNCSNFYGGAHWLSMLCRIHMFSWWPSRCNRCHNYWWWSWQLPTWWWHFISWIYKTLHIALTCLSLSGDGGGQNKQFVIFFLKRGQLLTKSWCCRVITNLV